MRTDAFNTVEAQEPMSPYKQRQMQQLLQKANDVTPYDPNDTYQFISDIQEKRRYRIFTEERHAIDTSTETLCLLNIIIYNINHLEEQGISLPGVITIGKYLRERGDKVDYVKLDTWITKLHIKSMLSFFTSILIDIFHFEKNEIPYAYNMRKDTEKQICNFLLHGQGTGTINKTRTLFRYSPLAALGYWTQRTRTALDRIEE